MLWDRGYWEPEGTRTPEHALAKGDFKFTLEGSACMAVLSSSA
jgi:bifunctional non-homologous end joining protein LigD